MCVCVCITGNLCFQAIRVLTKKANIYGKSSIFLFSYKHTKIVQFFPSEYMQTSCTIFVCLAIVWVAIHRCQLS